MRPAGEFGRVGLGKHDGDGGLEPAYHFRILHRHVILVERRGECGADAGRRRHVLDRDRQAVQRTERLALHDGAFSAPRRVERLVCGEGHDRVELGIDLLDHLEVRIKHLDRADGAGANEPRQLARRLARERKVRRGLQRRCRWHATRRHRRWRCTVRRPAGPDAWHRRRRIRRDRRSPRRQRRRPRPWNGDARAHRNRRA